MEKERDYIDTYFTELGDLQVTPPGDVWERIDDSLRKKRVAIIKFWTGMAAGLVMFFSVGGYLFFSNLTQDKAGTVTTISQTNKVTKTEKHSGINNYSIAKDRSSKKTQNLSPVQTRKDRSAINHSVNGLTNTSLVISHDIPPSITQVESGSNVNPDYYNENERLAALPAYVKGNIVEPHIIIQVNVPEPVVLTGIINTLDIKRKHQWAVAGQVAPLYSYRRDASYVDNNNEKALMAYAGGFKIDYESSRKISFQAGVYLSVMGQQIENITAKTARVNGINLGTKSNSGVNTISNSFGSIENNSGTVYSKGNDAFYDNVASADYMYMSSNMVTQKISNVYVENGKISQEMKFIEIPFLIRYKLIDDKLGIHLIGGITTHFLVDDQSFFHPEGGNKRSIGETSDLSTVNYSSTIGLGLGYTISRKINFSLEPTYKYYLNSFSTNKENNVHPYSFGIFTGIFYKF